MTYSIINFLEFCDHQTSWKIWLFLIHYEVPENKKMVFHSEYTTLTFMYERLCIFMRFYIIGLIERSWRSHIFILKYIIAEAWKHWVMYVCVWVWCHTIMRPQVTSRWHDTPDNTWSTDTRQRHPRIRQTNELWIEISTDTKTVSAILLRKHSGKQLSTFTGTLCFLYKLQVIYILLKESDYFYNLGNCPSLCLFNYRYKSLFLILLFYI